LFRQKMIWRGMCFERLHVRNFTRGKFSIALTFGFDADYADIFEIRGERRARRGKLLGTRTGSDFAELAYRGLDDVVRYTHIRCDPQPLKVTETEFALEVELEGRSQQVISLTVGCREAVST